MKHITGRRLGAACVLFAAACSSSPPEPSGPPKNQGNACAILDQRQDWGAALTRTQRKWGAPPEVVMAIIWRELLPRHRPPAKEIHLLGLTPYQHRLWLLPGAGRHLGLV